MFSLRFRSSSGAPVEQESLKSNSKFYKSISLTDLSDDFFRESLERDSPFTPRRPLTTKMVEPQPETPPVTVPPIVTTELQELANRSEPPKRTPSASGFKDPINSFIRRYRKASREEAKVHLISDQKEGKRTDKIDQSTTEPSTSTQSKGSESGGEEGSVPFPRSVRSYSIPSCDFEGLKISWKFNDDLERTETATTDDVRDRSKVGLRGSLPFTASSSSTTSGVSSGASDTQSQGSGGTDSKSDSLTPEGCRKGSQGRSSSSGPSVSGSGISSRVNKGVEMSKMTGEREASALRQEVETLRAEITKARQTILHMQERDGKRKDRYGDRATIDRLSKLSGCPGSRLENINLGERRPTALVRRYAHLYAQTRLDTFDALDSLPDLRSADELKAKLLFSVVVLAFRSVTTTAAALRDEVRRLLQMMPPSPQSPGAATASSPDPDSPSSRAVDLAISSYIASSVDSYDLTKNVDEVCEQIWATLYDYPSLKMSEALLQYTKDCVRISWGLVNQNPPYLLEYETRIFRKDLHVRFHSANPNSDVIKTYLWPSLVEGTGGPCVHQGIVMT